MENLKIILKNLKITTDEELRLYIDGNYNDQSKISGGLRKLVKPISDEAVKFYI